ncbi:hypothetical protein [Streptomyces sp. NPDC058466]|uniref:hypothetical protein n=1 Tax=Streptomyces sp. NPDC058466 TaxID=3346512 RepID=UPI003665F365
MEASRISAEQKVRAFSHLGFAVDHVVLPDTVSAAEFADRCNADPATRAVIVQFPPPARLVPLVQRLDPAKDIDGLLGRRSLQRACATADGISRIVAPFAEGAGVAVVGARGFVGSGVMRLLADRGITPLPLDQGDDLRRAADADVVVSTAGSAHLLPRSTYVHTIAWWWTRDFPRGPTAPSRVTFTPRPPRPRPTASAVVVPRAEIGGRQ